MDPTERSLPAQIGRYQIERLLGRGAMGRVLLAHDPVLDRSVAIKLLRDDLQIPPEQHEALLHRMRQEARASARVSHPNIVSLHDMGEDPELGLCLVFEYAEGLTLKERLLRGPLGPEAAAKLAREVGDALTTAHSAGVLHRDIKPENIILTPTGAKVADFGIARVPDSTLTRDGGLLGTPAYSAPECIETGKFSPLSDQFSLAATLYEAVSGLRAFPGEDAIAVATRITNEEASPIAEIAGVDPHVDEVLARGLCKDPAARYEDARALGLALSEALFQSPRSKQPTLPDQRHHSQEPSAHESRTARLVIGGAAIGALLGIAGFQLMLGLREPDRAAEATTRSEAVDAGAASSTPPMAVSVGEAPKPKTKPSPTKHEPRAQRGDAGAPLRADAGKAQELEP
ncbi:MAG TPA: serine/threonine-protein kinase [Polyangiaceae bacterium]|jgi:serine/threonine-protein kinase|nr:serine/threonine-protein kinase [Polyangiaceae bacterium]